MRYLMTSSKAFEWALVAAVATAFLLIPALILWRPPALPFRVSFIILPLLPAIGLAVVAVWFAIHRRDRLGDNANP